MFEALIDLQLRFCEVQAAVQSKRFVEVAQICREQTLSVLENIRQKNFPFIRSPPFAVFMNRAKALSLIVLTTLLAISALLPSIPSATASPYIDPLLSYSRSHSSPDALVEVVITLDHIPTLTDVETINSRSRLTAPMNQLPMILAITTYSELDSMASHPGVVSLFQNRALDYYGNVKTVTHSFGEVPVQHSWWNDVMRVPSAWALGYRGQGVTAAVIDTGIDATNPSLGFRFPNGLSSGPERVIQNVKVLTIGELLSTQEQRPPLGPDQIYLENQPNTDTTGGHGTSVAGLIAGTGAIGKGIYMGAAPEATVVGLGAGDTLAIFHVLASFNYIFNHPELNIRIVNNSWGLDFECSLLLEGLLPDPEACRSRSPITTATREAHDRGIAVFFAAGNSGPGHPTINPFSEPPWVISVTAGTESKGLAEFSSRGCAEGETHPVCTNIAEQQPDIVAPGTNVIAPRATLTGVTDSTLTTTTDLGNIVDGLQPYYNTFGGTSAASPMAAGVAAIVLSAVNLSPDELKAVLKETADPTVGYLSFQQGEGYLNAHNAVKAAQGKGFKPTTVKTEAFGIQRFTYTTFIAGDVVVTSPTLSANFPAFQGAQEITFTLTWPIPSYPRQWRMEIYGPNDSLVALFRSEVQTSIEFQISNATLIASLNNRGFNSGTWTVLAINFGEGQALELTVDVLYPKKSTLSMKTASSLHVEDSGGVNGVQAVVFQRYDGSLESLAQITTPTDIGTSSASVIVVVRVVTLNGAGNIVEVRGAFVMTQTDLSTRASEIQQLLLATTDPMQVSALEAELLAIQQAILTAPTSESLPPLPD